ncbi:sigma factor [Roseibium sp.]|uniref:sigma factor n=1 Tax=Roseibium sp. TaxID=1936156 RepID=UPI003A978A75
MSKQNELLKLHGQLLAGDMRASSKIVELTVAQLVAIVARDVAGLHDKQDVEQACFDALFKYLAAPDKYDPNRAELMTYLAAIAKGKAMTLRRSQGRRMKYESEYAATEDLSQSPLAEPEDENTMVSTIDWMQFGDVLIKDDGDAEVVALMKLGAASADAVASSLGLKQDADGLAEADRRIERIRGRARRLKGRMEA